jgi:hypothetical protein
MSHPLVFFNSSPASDSDYDAKYLPIMKKTIESMHRIQRHLRLTIHRTRLIKVFYGFLFLRHHFRQLLLFLLFLILL